MIENLEPDRTQGGVEKCLSSEILEERLEAEFATGGEAALNKLRDEARGVASATGLDYGFSRLDKLIGALLSTRPAAVLKSSVARRIRRIAEALKTVQSRSNLRLSSRVEVKIITGLPRGQT